MKKGRGKPGEMAEKAAEVLMACFRVCASDRYTFLAVSRKLLSHSSLYSYNRHPRTS